MPLSRRPRQRRKRGPRTGRSAIEEEEEDEEEEEEEDNDGKVHKLTETKQRANLHIVHWWARSEIKCVYSVAVISDHERRAGVLTTVSFLVISTPHYCCTITTFLFLSKHISLPLRLKLGMYLTCLILPIKPNFKWVGHILVHNQPFTTQKFYPTLSISDTRNNTWWTSSSPRHSKNLPFTYLIHAPTNKEGRICGNAVKIQALSRTVV